MVTNTQVGRGWHSVADPGPTDERPLEILLLGMTPERLGWAYRPLYIAVRAFLEHRFGRAMLTRAYDGHDRTGCRTWLPDERTIASVRLRVALLLTRMHQSDRSVVVLSRFGTE